MITTRRALLWVAGVVFLLVWVFRDLVLLVGYSVLLAYALLPVVAALQRPAGPNGPRLPRGIAAALVMFGLVTLVGWLLTLAVPRLAVQAARFIEGAPAAIARLDLEARRYGESHGLSAWMDPAIDAVRDGVTNLVQGLSGAFAEWAAGGFGGLGQLLGLALLPVLAFYLLAEPTAVRASALRFVPEAAHSELARVGRAVDQALRAYVRGQAIVCLVMGFAVGTALAIMGSPLALLLGLLVGLAELVPYLGFIVAAGAIALAGVTVDPWHAAAGVAVYTFINWAIGTFVAPRVMGRHLRMHPFVVTVSILAGTQVFGPAGALLGLPGAAMLQAVVGELATPEAATHSEE